MWASDMPDGSPGVAVWDLYAAEDADKVRLTCSHSLLDRHESAWRRKVALAGLPLRSSLC